MIGRRQWEICMLVFLVFVQFPLRSFFFRSCLTLLFFWISVLISVIWHCLCLELIICISLLVFLANYSYSSKTQVNWRVGVLEVQVGSYAVVFLLWMKSIWIIAVSKLANHLSDHKLFLPNFCSICCQFLSNIFMLEFSFPSLAVLILGWNNLPEAFVSHQCLSLYILSIYLFWLQVQEATLRIIAVLNLVLHWNCCFVLYGQLSTSSVLVNYCDLSL